MESDKIFEKPFDFNTYLEQWLLSIDGVTERAFARNYLADTLRLMMQESEKSYQALEQRVYDEVTVNHDKYAVHMNVVKRSRYDITAGDWFSLIPGDEVNWNKRRIDCCQEMPFVVDCLFSHADMDGLLHLMNQSDQTLIGRVQTTKGVYTASFRVKQSTQYQKCIERLYGLFCDNDIPWKTINAGYLFRFFDLEIMKMDDVEADMGQIIGYELDVDVTMKGLRSDFFPVWNIQKNYYDSTQFVMPAIDQKYYEHCVQMDKDGEQIGYLIEGNEHMISFRHTENEIVILTTQETFRQWVIYEIIKNPSVSSYLFDTPVLHNRVQGSFTGSYLHKTGISIHSKMEVMRFAQQYDLQDQIKLIDVTVLQDVDQPKDKTYLSMIHADPALEQDPRAFLPCMQLNWFIQEDLVNPKEQKVLLFHFSREKEHFLQYDLLSFVLCELQRQFDQYRCESVWHQGA